MLVFLGTDCPIGNLYVPRLIELNRDYHNKGVVFLGINSNAHETEQDLAKYVRETGIDFPVLKDQQNKVSDSILVERTCETLVLDGFGRIRYRGAIDDQYLQGKSKDHPEQMYLRDALDALLANRPIKVPATRVFGCLLDRVDPKPVEAYEGAAGSGTRHLRSMPRWRPAITSIRSRSGPSPMPPMSAESSRRSASRATGPTRSGRSRS